MKSLYEELNGSYVEVGGVQIPALVSTDTNYEIGFWGQRHREYLKEHHRVIYFNLLTQCKLNSYLHNIDVRAKERYDLLVKQLAETQGITEQLKADDMIVWVGSMNNIANQVREIVYKEIIYKY
ncbi:MAG: TnpV protein [Bacteroides sp.]|nr:TnpV protein [Bacteroides sp.]MCM1433604.1 TnpV protein [Clostridiales bacterium]